jgi:hypothetical protein
VAARMKKTALLFLILFFSTSSIADNGLYKCDNTGRYCVGEGLYDCVDGEPQLVKYCNHACSKGECVTERMEPEDSLTIAEPEPEETTSNDLIFYISLAIVVSVILILALRLKLKKR